MGKTHKWADYPPPAERATYRRAAFGNRIGCGVSTCGCVRAAAHDAFSHNFRVIVVAEACGHRSPAAHPANPFDMAMKFADVEPLSGVIAELDARYGPDAAATA